MCNEFAGTDNKPPMPYLLRETPRHHAKTSTGVASLPQASRECPSASTQPPLLIRKPRHAPFNVQSVANKSFLSIFYFFLFLQEGRVVGVGRRTGKWSGRH